MRWRIASRVGSGLSADERRRRDDLTRCAEPALEGVCPHEGVDERVVAEPLDRRHLALVERRSQRDAREDGVSVEEHGAGAAMAFAAADLRAGQAQILSQDLCDRP